MCDSKDSFHEKPSIHLVSAYAKSNQLASGQVNTSEKSSKIIAIPEIIEYT